MSTILARSTAPARRFSSANPAAMPEPGDEQAQDQHQGDRQTRQARSNRARADAVRPTVSGCQTISSRQSTSSHPPTGGSGGWVIW